MTGAQVEFSAMLARSVAEVAPSLVSLHAARSRWTGFVWQPGLVVTADEALPEDGEVHLLRADGSSLAAQLAGRDPTTDLALLRVDTGGAQPARLVDTPVAAGALALAVGSEDDAPTAALGVVARAGAAWRSMRGGEIAARLELDLRLRRSAEGGLALDAAGQAFGMLAFGPRRRTLVIPTATITRVAEKLASDGRIRRGYLGLGMQPVAIDGGGSGVMVLNVDHRGPGATAGLLQGDIITAVDGTPVGQIRALLRALGSDTIGRSVTVAVRRGGQAREIAVVVGERPGA